MSWKDLLQHSTPESICLPWTGGKQLRLLTRTWQIEGRLPPEFGWYRFNVSTNRKASLSDPTQEDPNHDLLINIVQGYLIGDRLIADSVRVDPNPSQIISNTERVFLIEPGLDRFVRVSAGRVCEDGPLIYKAQEMPLGPEEEVLTAFLDQKNTVSDIKGVAPALDSAFRFESWRREETEKRRLEAERQAREEEERIRKEEERKQLYSKLGDGASRRLLARTDFKAAAQAALTMGNAEYLDHRPSPNRNETIVRFRYQNRRFECVCNTNSLQIIDAGVCLRGFDSYTEEEVIGDTRFSLESLPSVIGEAIRLGVLHVFRHG